MTSIFLLLASSPCLAYVGPGPGVTMIGALIGLVLTIFGALVAISLWPIRVLRRRAAERRAARTSNASNSNRVAEAVDAAEAGNISQAAAGPPARP